jgi:excinuclease ABC subunit C
MAPCQGNIERNEYMNMINNIIKLLSGKNDELIRELKLSMSEAAENYNFERAAELRDSIISIQKVQEKQKMISTSLEDEDVIAYTNSEEGICIEIFFIRGGKLLGRENFYFEVTSEDGKEILSQFVMQFYSEEFIPKTIILPEDFEEAGLIETYLTEKKGSKVHIRVPKRGEKLELVDMARKNAEAAIEQMKYKNSREKQMTEGALEELQVMLELDCFPCRIEAYDISNIQGTDPVGSMVVFEGGKPKNKDYRRFKIKTVEGPNDYASMEEVIKRRFLRGISERESLTAQNKEPSLGKFSNFPDLVLIDGGEGQVGMAQKVFDELGIIIPICGMVKDDKHRTRGLLYNRQEVLIYKESNAFKLITRIQDEAHRFAITYHRSLRGKNSIASVLNEINGIGEKRRKALLKKFNDINEIKNASVEALKSVEGMNEPSARAVFDFFHKDIINQ